MMTRESKRRYIGAVGGNVDAWIDSAISFAADQPELRGIWWNKGAPEGLRLYLGKRTATWQYFSQRRDHGDRAHTFKTLGRYDRGFQASSITGARPTPEYGSPPDEGDEPGPPPPNVKKLRRTPPIGHLGSHPVLHRAEWHMSYQAACDAATVERAGVIKGAPSINPEAGPTFAQAFDGGYEIVEGRKSVKIEGYLQYLERKAKEAGKPPRWAAKVRSLGNVYMMPKWGKWRLIEMSEAPNFVDAWCTDIKSATSANHIARIMRAMWRRVAKRDRNLEIVAYPTRVYEKRKERSLRKGMPAKGFAAWYEVVQGLPSPVRRAYHLCNLLTGTRPGELARTTWQGNSVDGELLSLGNIKTRLYAVHTTPEIRACLKAAADATPKHKPDDLIFPGCESNMDRDKLPIRGHALRRTYRTFAHSVKVQDQIGDWLLGDAPPGIRPSYLPQWLMEHNEAIIAAQHKISRAMMAALTAKPAVKRKRAA